MKISKNVIDFGHCPLNERRDFFIVLENQNEEIPIDLNFQKIPSFTFNPNCTKLYPQQTISVISTFHPKNVGNYNNTIELQLMNKSYK